MNGTDIRDLFSRNLKRLRARQDLSQLDLANMAGLTHTFINDIENRKKWTSSKTIAKLCDALNVEAFQLFLSENYLEEIDKKAISTYVDDLSTMINSSVNDFKSRYIHTDPKDS
jgi:transcriptional regulator with XRE-family HTH domain